MKCFWTVSENEFEEKDLVIPYVFFYKEIRQDATTQAVQGNPADVSREKKSRVMHRALSLRIGSGIVGAYELSCVKTS